MMTSAIALTAIERQMGRLMRAPEHGDDRSGVDVVDPPADPGDGHDSGEINDPVIDEGSSDQGGDPPPASGDDDQGGDEPPADQQPDANADLNARLADMERRFQEAERDREYWMGRANGTINEDGTPVGQPPAEGADPNVDPDMPDPKNYTYGETDAAYIKDLARYEARQEFLAQQAEQEVRSSLQNVETQHAERVGKAKERYQDYDEVVVKGANPDPVTKEPKWFCSQLMSLGIKTSEQGPDIAYHLASNPQESLRIAQMPPLEQAREFGRLEYRFEQEAKTREGDGGGSSPETRTTGAPPPPPRARGSGSNSGPVAADTDDFAAFEARADAHRKSQKRR